MANAETSTPGRAVRITTQRMEGGPPVPQLWFAAIDDDEIAIAAVRDTDQSTPDEDVEIVGMLSATTIEALSMAPGDVRRA